MQDHKATLIIPGLNQQTNPLRVPLFSVSSYCTYIQMLFKSSYSQLLVFRMKIRFSAPSLTSTACQYTGEQDRMRQAVLGAWALFNQLQT